MEQRKQWIALTAVAVVAVLAAGWFLLVSPQRAEAADLRQQTADQESTNAQLRTQLAVLKNKAKELPKEQAKLAAVAAKLPADPAQPALLRALATAADAAGVEFISVAPGTPTPVLAAGATAEPSAAGTLLSMPLTISVHGGYYGLEQYVAALEDLPRALRLTVLTVAPGVSPVDPKPLPTGTGVSEAAAAEAAAEEAAKLTDGRHLAMTITANVYIASQEPVAAPAAPAAQPTSQETS